MGKPLKKIKLSEARSKLTQLKKILEPGESLQLTKRGKPYARIELIEGMDLYEKTLKSIEALPEPKGKLQRVAQGYKSILYGKRK
jgi:antitoxin (DNA-binding transcriptional repressor) of toxin-antitoxin stability system